jgi:hypothetical protein
MVTKPINSTINYVEILLQTIGDLTIFLKVAKLKTQLKSDLNLWLCSDDAIYRDLANNFPIPKLRHVTRWTYSIVFIVDKACMPIEVVPVPTLIDNKKQYAIHHDTMPFNTFYSIAMICT